MLREEDKKLRAKDYGLRYPIVTYDADGNSWEDWEESAIGFEAGFEYADNTMIERLKQVLRYKLCFNENKRRLETVFAYCSLEEFIDSLIDDLRYCITTDMRL